MKSAEDWVNEIGTVHSGNDVWNRISPDQVRKIQADVLYYAADLIGGLPMKYNRMHAWDGPYRAACVFGRSHLREKAANLTRLVNPDYENSPNIATSFDKPTE